MFSNKIFLRFCTKIIFGASVVYAWHLSYSGYCFGKFKYFTDEEYIESAIRHNALEMGIDGSEESIKNFHAMNPNCCSVNRTALSWKEHMLSGNYVTVELNYKSKNPFPIDTKYIFYKKYIQILECGKGSRQYGESTKSLESAL